MNTLQSKLFSRGIALPVITMIGLLLVRQISEYDIWFHMAMGILC